MCKKFYQNEYFTFVWAMIKSLLKCSYLNCTLFPVVGEVGPPLSCNMVKLADVPEMNYYAADNVGEVCGKGKNVFRGYFKDEAKTKDTIDSDGWLHTGDIGMWTEVCS